MQRKSFLLCLFLITALGGCSVAPSEKTVERAISDFFESGHYKVVDLKIVKIQGMALSEKTYMGMPGYVVDIISITLEPLTDKGIDIKKGKRLTFTNARIRLIQDRTIKNMWHVSIISGIPVP